MHDVVDLVQVVLGADLTAEVPLGAGLGAGGVRGQRDAQLGVPADADRLAEPRDRRLAGACGIGDLGDAPAREKLRRARPQPA